MDLDRPHFPEASNTVGRGRVILETGYTYAAKGSRSQVQTYPEAVLRVGLFADWFEFRVTQSFTTQRLRQPGVNYDFSWDIVKDRLSVEGVVSANGARDDAGHRYVLVATGLTAVVDVTRNLQAFVEGYGLYPAGAVGPETGPQHYADGGLVHFIGKNIALDVRAGAGLNDHANDYFVGAGFSVRY